MAPYLSIEGLRKTYRGNWIVDAKSAVVDVSFEVAAGEVVGLLGPNGSGKSTTFKCVTGLVRPTAGRIELVGRSPRRREARASLGFLPEDASFHDFLTGEEYVDLAARLVGVPARARRDRVHAVLERVGLAEAKRRRIRTYSKGMVQRVGIAQAIVGEPKLVILDEPMTGLDPLGRREVRDLMAQLGREGAAVVFSTHVLQDVELVCSRVVILAAGRVLRQGTLAELLADKETGAVEVTVRGLTGGSADSAAGIDAELVARNGDVLVFRALNQDSAHRLAEEVRFRGGSVVSVQPVGRTLEDVFLREIAEARAH
jgi:ABC-2 type transport system ATP-binding protein